MATAKKDITIKAGPDAVMEVIADLAAYPGWSSVHKKTAIESTDDEGRPTRVRMTVSVAGISDEQVLDYTWDGDRSVSWTLVEGGQQRRQSGRYQLSANGSATAVHYEVSVDPKIPMPGFIVKQGMRKVVDAATSGLKKSVERGR
jgi:ribosome-associated toxin RatA of RatAB toxin-antitoxin module